MQTTRWNTLLVDPSPVALFWVGAGLGDAGPAFGLSGRRAQRHDEPKTKKAAPSGAAFFMSRRLSQPWRALKRRCVLLMTYTRPLRRTIRQSRWRDLRERSEFLTFMSFSNVVQRACAFRFLSSPSSRYGRAGMNAMVGTTRFELVTPSMSTKCSTTELSAHLTPDLRHAHSKQGAPKHGGSALYRRSRKPVQGLLNSSQNGLYFPLSEAL